MGDSVSKLCEQGRPEVRECLQCLRGWNREDLSNLVDQFRSLNALSIRLSTFWRILKFETREVAEAAFAALGPRDGKVDFLSIIGPMVIISDQHVISRASMLFSIFDFNSAGSVNRAEFFIGMRTMFKGLAHFFASFPAPKAAELEQLTNNLFNRMDNAGADLILLGEALSFAYRSKGFRMLTAPFFSSDRRLFEEQIFFAGQSPMLEKQTQQTAKAVEKTLRNQLRLTPDQPEESAGTRRQIKERRRERPWKQPATITRGHAWLAWRSFNIIAGGERVISAEMLKKTLRDEWKVDQVLQQAITSEEQNDSKPEDVSRLTQRMTVQMSGAHTLERLDEMAESSPGAGISFRAFCCLVWPIVKECDIEACVTWCKMFQAQKVLSDLIKLDESKLDLDMEDIEELFDAVDTNYDGRLPVDEHPAGLTSSAQVEVAGAKQLIAKLEKDNSGALSKGEVRAVIFGIDSALREQFKGTFTADEQAHQQKLQQQN